MFLFALLIAALLTLLHIAMGGAVLYHIGKYRMEKDVSKRAVLVYVMLSAFVLGIILLLLFTTPWDEFALPS